MIPTRAWWSVYLLVLGSCWGCATSPLSSTMPPPSAPFFSATSEDTTQLALLASELDTMALGCIAENACNDQVHFSRALLSLFENREAARVSFEQVISRHTSSPLAASSALWLKLLKDEGPSSPSNDPQRGVLIELIAQGVRQWMTWQLAGPSNHQRTAGLPQPDLMQSLYKQVQERDRRITDLRSQLNALKIIAQDQDERQRKMRPPASLVPRIENYHSR